MSQDSRFPGRDLSAGPPEYEAEALTLGRNVRWHVIHSFTYSQRDGRGNTDAQYGHVHDYSVVRHVWYVIARILRYIHTFVSLSN
jgi:hypothetical protein